MLRNRENGCRGVCTNYLFARPSIFTTQRRAIPFLYNNSLIHTKGLFDVFVSDWTGYTTAYFLLGHAFTLFLSRVVLSVVFARSIFCSDTTEEANIAEYRRALPWHWDTRVSWNSCNRPTTRTPRELRVRSRPSRKDANYLCGNPWQTRRRRDHLAAVTTTANSAAAVVGCCCRRCRVSKMETARWKFRRRIPL